MAKFLSRYTNELLHEGQSSIAAEIIAKYGSPAHPLMSQVYNLLSEELLRSASNEYVNVLRAMLSSLVAQQNFKIANSEHLKISKCLMIAQFLHQRAKCAQNADLAVIGAKLALSVLRYTDKIPADAAFYEAGQLCKNVGMLNMAFVCWNRFLDLSEAIDEGDTGAIDNGDFLNTDIPFDSCISRHYVEVFVF